MDDQKKPFPLTDAVEPEHDADPLEQDPLGEADAEGQIVDLLDEEEDETQEAEESEDSEEENDDSDDDGSGDEVAFKVKLRVIAWIPGRYPIV